MRSRYVVCLLQVILERGLIIAGIEPCQNPQNLRNGCFDRCIHTVHVCKCRILCCWYISRPTPLRIYVLTDQLPVPKEELESSKLTTAALFFSKVFGDSGAVRGLNFLIALASFGNMIAVIIGLSRRIREAGRQGVLPFTKFWVSTQPFGTPLGPYAVIWGLTALLIVAVPAGDAFTFGMYIGV
jgi:hypothetical protein